MMFISLLPLKSIFKVQLSHFSGSFRDMFKSETFFNFSGSYKRNVDTYMPNEDISYMPLHSAQYMLKELCF
jgi:hypothetical protein